MTFDEVWMRVHGLPYTAMVQVPGTLRDDTKRKLAKKTPEEVGRIVAEAVDKVNHGSLEAIDTLVNTYLVF